MIFYTGRYGPATFPTILRFIFLCWLPANSQLLRAEEPTTTAYWGLAPFHQRWGRNLWRSLLHQCQNESMCLICSASSPFCECCLSLCIVNISDDHLASSILNWLWGPRKEALQNWISFNTAVLSWWQTLCFQKGTIHSYLLLALNKVTGVTVFPNWYPALEKKGLK